MFGNLIKATFYIRKNKLFEKVREFSLFATIFATFPKRLLPHLHRYVLQP